MIRFVATGKYLAYILFSFCCAACVGQKENTNSADIGILFYNVENLFDTIDTPDVIDSEFTPVSDKNWNTEKYQTKLDHVAQVIANTGDAFPAIVGLCEVENRQVVDDLVNNATLLDAEYYIVHFDSPDERGIDVALLYRRDFFKIEETKPIRVVLPEENGGKTRDILYVRATVKKTKTQVHIFVNHWPSRSEGEELTSIRRAIAAETLRTEVETLQEQFDDPFIIIMGDFNDTPSDNSIQNILHANSMNNSDCNRCLINIITAVDGQNAGSYFYGGQWQILDQFIVSPAVLSNERLHYKANSVKFIRNDFQLYKSDKYGYLPNRTYSGIKYYGGYSDHLPVYMQLELR